MDSPKSPNRRNKKKKRYETAVNPEKEEIDVEEVFIFNFFRMLSNNPLMLKIYQKKIRLIIGKGN